MPSANSFERCATYGLIQTQILSPRSRSRSSMPRGSGNVTRVPLEVAPVELPHPERVEVEDRQRQVALGHPVDEARDRRLVVGGGERRGQPQAERPGRQPCGPSGQRGVPPQDVLRRRTVDDEVLQRLALDAELRAGHGLRGHLERHAAGMVHEHPVARVGEVERHVLVRLLAGGTAVGVPDLDALAVLDEGTEALTEAVHVVVDAEVELLAYVVRAARGLHDRGALGAVARSACRPAARNSTCHGPVLATRTERSPEVSTVDSSPAETTASAASSWQREPRLPRLLAREVRDRHADDVRHGRGVGQRDRGPLEQVAPMPDRLRRRVHAERAGRGGDVEHFDRIGRLNAVTQHPVAVGEPHPSPFT